MKNNKGITLVTVIATVVLLVIISGLSVYYGIDTYKASKVAKFETYMRAIQKKVDILMEEEVDYTTIGSPISEQNITKLQQIIEQDYYVETTEEDLAETEYLRYFSSADISTYFEIDNTGDEIVVNFANREIISLNGIEKDGIMHYVEVGLH